MKGGLTEAQREANGMGGHRLSVEFEQGMPRLTLIHPESGCHEGRCTSCGGEGCDECPTPGECWMQAWVDHLGAECLEGGPVEFPVTAECDGEEFYLHVAPEALSVSAGSKEER